MSARIYDHNGWYEIPANPISRAGVFDYLGSSINAPEPGKIYKVYRPAEELSDPETLASFRLVPFIDNHTMLGDSAPGFVPAENKGVAGVTGENIVFDAATNTMFGNLKVFSNTLDRKIQAGKIDVSLGYRAKYDWTPGTYNGLPFDCVQRFIRGNHIALVDDGRMGDRVSVMDGNFTVTFDAKDIKPMSKWSDAIIKRMGLGSRKHAKGAVVATMDAADAEVASAGTPTLEDVADLLKDVLPQIADINSAMAAASGAATGGSPDDDMEPEMDDSGNPVMDGFGKPKMKKKAPPAAAATPAATPATTDAAATMDAAIAKAVKPLMTAIAALTSAQTGTKQILAEVGKRNALAGQLSNFVGTFDSAEMTLSEVAKYGVEKLSIPCVDGQEVSAVMAYLHGRPVHKAGSPVRQTAAASKSLDKYLSE